MAEVVELVGTICTHRFIVGWPAEVDASGLIEQLWLRGLELNAAASFWLQANTHTHTLYIITHFF